MPNDRIYLHEIITIVGAGSEPYKAHTGADWEQRWRDGRAMLVGTWQQSGSTGDWPRVVNLWEMRGWDHWAEILAAQYKGEGQPKTLQTWWNKALEYRSGGFDRILEPTADSPTCHDLVARGVKGRATIQEIATVRSGTVDDYLDAVHRLWQPAAERRGMTLVGAYRTTMRDTEAVLLWSLPTLRDFTDYLKAVRTDAEVQRWHDRSRQWRTDYRETLLIPSPWCVLHHAANLRRHLTGQPASPSRGARAARRTPRGRSR